MIELKTGESRQLNFIIKDGKGDPVNCVGATFELGVKKSPNDSSYKIRKTHSDFNTTDAANGRVSVVLTSSDTDIPEDEYIMELKIEFSADNIKKSDDIRLKIKKSVT